MMLFSIVLCRVGGCGLAHLIGPTDPYEYLKERINQVRVDSNRGGSPLHWTSMFENNDPASDEATPRPDTPEESEVDPTAHSPMPQDTQHFDLFPIVGIAQDRNGRSMEDDAYACTTEGGHPIRTFVAVFDGHSANQRHGKKAAILARNNLYSMTLRTFDSRIRRAQNVPFGKVLEDAFKATENYMKRHEEDFQQAGTTATCVCIVRSVLHQAYTLHAGNVGDSQAFLFTAEGFEPLTRMHMATDIEEQKRAVAEGAMLTDNDWGVRINGLQITRSLGDLESPQTSCVPHTVDLELAPSHRWVVLASDGYWDVATPEATHAAIREYEASLAPLPAPLECPGNHVAQHLATQLLQAALAQYRAGAVSHRDNITVAALYLNWRAKPPAE
eukprot:gnl/Trimastix_PCT/1910.p1 GENE.gnl/Trimastix_PCT/1910~~gnl/Trimastix_PCT/1910.p1  ORF type:complete len:387 (+),score=111.45 gnl/Trimastix_PCT/1910:83-1243(+)